MKRRWFALLLAAAVLCAAAVPAGAAETVELPAQPLSARADAPVGEFATVLEMQIKSGVYSSMLVKTDSYDKLLLHFSEQTVLMDTQTGLPVLESAMQKGDKVYIYRDACVDASYPAQSGVRAVVTNLDEMHAPAHLLTVEAVENRPDGGLTVLCEEGGLRLTVSAKASVSPLTTKNIVTLDDLHIGTRFFAWYDVVAESYPARAGTDQVVILPPEDCTVGLIVEDDMAIWGGGRIENGAVVVPVRAVAEALGYTVYWNGSLQRVTLKKEGATAALIQLGQDRYAFGDGGSGVSLGAAAYEVDGTTWVSAELFSKLHHSVALCGDTLHIDSAMCGYPLASE